MAVVTWDGSSSTAYSTAANWDTGSVPADGDDVIIPDTSGGSINACNVGSNDSCNSLTVLANGEIGSNAGAKLFILGEADGTGATTDGYAVNIDGIITVNSGTSLDLDIRTEATTLIDLAPASGSTIRNLTINHASCVATMYSDVSLSGTLAISAGQLTTGSNHVLTVTGNISGNGTLTCNASTVTVTGQSTVGTLNITTGTYNYYDDFRPTTANITDNATFNQTSIGGHLGGRIIIGSGKTPTFNAVGRLHSSLDIRTGEQGNSTFNLDLSEPQNGPARALFFYNLELDSQGTENNTLTMKGAMTFTGNLTITDGIINTESGVNHALTVTGELSNAGTFTGNASLVTVRNLLITAGTFTAPSDSGSGDLVITGEGNAGSGDGYAFRRTGGTFTHSSGTVTFTDNTTVSVRMNGVGSGQKFNNVILNEASAGLILQTNDEGFYCEGDLTLTAGDFDLTSSAALVTVDGDVSIADGHTLGSISSQQTANNSFGSLTIADGGTYNATSGTTTITGEIGTKCYDNQSGGTFTHNNGTLAFAASIGDTTFDNAGADDFYNLSALNNGDCKYLNAITVLNNLIINHSNVNFRANTDGSGAITVHGITRLVLGIAFHTSDDNANADHYGFIQVEGGTLRISDTSSATKTCDGIRNIGGTISG